MHHACRSKLQQQGWKVVVTGHSLGAAVACMLGMQLRERFAGEAKPSPAVCVCLRSLTSSSALIAMVLCASWCADLQCWAFNPPGGLVSWDLAQVGGSSYVSAAVRWHGVFVHELPWQAD